MTRTFHLIVRCPFCVLRKWGFTMNFIQYIKQAWKAGTSGGTPLSPDRLNHIEDGIKNNNDMISKLNNNIIIETKKIGNKINIPVLATGATKIRPVDTKDGYVIASITPYTTSAGNAIAFLRRDDSNGALEIYVKNNFNQEIVLDVYIRIVYVKQ